MAAPISSPSDVVACYRFSVDKKPTIDQEARRLDLRADERDLDRAFFRTKAGLIIAIVVVAVLLVIGGFIFR
jgi:hypothetical protein